MYERGCCEISNAIAPTASNTTTRATATTTTSRRTRTTARVSNENNEYKCKCQRNFQSRTHHSCSIASSSNRKATPANQSVNMQTQQQHMQLQQSQQHQQSSNQLLHLQMPIENTTAFMENGLVATPSDSTVSNGCTSSLSSLSSSSSPPSPLSTSSLSSSSESSTTQATPSLGVNLRVTGQCSQGGRKYMEDYFSVAYQHSENAKDLEYAFFGIFDGHGGAEAATFAKEHLMMEIINQKLFWSDSDQDVLRAIREGYIATHFAMWREQDKWPKTANGLPSTAGTTATIAFIRHEKIYIGHVGDSGIVLGYQNDGEKCWRAKQLTTDHKPESMAERARIMRSGGKVVVKSGVPRVVWNRPRNAGHRGPIRHNTPIDEIPFLAVARSLGDLWSFNSLCNEFVVSPDPDVRVIKINPKTFRCLIFGTDGLWNVVTPQEAVNTVFHNETVNERLQRQRGENLSNENGWMNPSKVLVDRALGTWSAKKMRADNTSVVTVILHPPSNNSSSNTSVMSSVSGASKMEGSINDNFGLEYTHMNAAYVNNDETITYRDMAEKYLPPEEYRNFNYYEDSVECTVMNGSSKYYEDRYTKLSSSGPRYSLPNTLEALEFMCGNGEPAEHIAVPNLKNSVKEGAEASAVTEVKLSAADDDDDTDEEDCDDDDECTEDDSECPEAVSNDSDVLGLSNYAPQYMREQKSLSGSTNGFGVRSVDETTTSSYMSTFAESYNTLLNGDSVVTDTHISTDVSTSNSSNSYKSHSANCIQELVQEQQRYQQQCMSEEEGYSLTKLETRREQQRCSATGVQTFRIFQQQQQQQEQEQHQDVDNAAVVGVQRTSSAHAQISCQQNYMWEPRFHGAFGGNPRYQNYQQQQAQQQQFMLEQQLKSLELNSLLQQEREEEQQVELERQMEMERFQQQQSLQSNPQLEQHSKAIEKSGMATSDFLLVHGNDNASSEVLTPIATTNGDEADPDATIDEEYLLLDDDADVDDGGVQINEISSSCVLESDVPAKALPSTSITTLKAVQSFPIANPSPLLLSPQPSATPSRETLYADAIETTSDSSYENCVGEVNEPPKIIEKLEKIEILHEKPELVIEAAPASTMATRSKHKLNTALVSPTKKRCKPSSSTRLHFPNIPNENQHQQIQPANPCHTSIKNGMLQLTPVVTTEAQTIYSKRQLRSASNSSSSSGSSVGSVVGGSGACSIAAGSRKTCFHTTNSLNNNIDYVKRTLRTRNSLTKDLKAKTSLIASNIKRTTSTVTTRFLRTQAVNLLNIHQNPQVLGNNCKKSTSASAMMSSACTPRRPQQPQRPLTTATFNFINLRSRQIGGNVNGSSIPSFTESRQQQTSTQATSTPKSMQIRNLATNAASSTAINSTPNYVRRNLRSLSSVRSCIKGKVTVSTTTSGLTNYCKSMRSQSVTALVTPPPPSPKHLTPVASNVTFAVTRARTANNVMATSQTTSPLLLNGSIGLHNNRKRVVRPTEPSESILTAARTQKRLRR